METLVVLLNRAGDAFVRFHGAMWLQSSLLILVLLLLDRCLRRRLRAVTRYWIWSLVLIKLLLPPSLTSPIGLGQLMPDSRPSTEHAVSALPPGSLIEGIPQPSQATRSAQRPKSALNAPAKTRNTAVPASIASLQNASAPQMAAGRSVTSPLIAYESPKPRLTGQGLLLTLWGASVLAMLLFFTQRLWQLKGLLASSVHAKPTHRDLLARCKKEMRVVRSVRLKVLPMPGSPAVVGLLRPTILLPQAMLEELDESHLRSIFLHELAHIKRGDLWVSLVQSLQQILYFYNPLLWVANATLRTVREQAVDETVLVTLGSQAAAYPRTLLDISKISVQRPSLSLRLTGLVESKKALADRIRHIATHPLPKSAKLGCSGLVALALLGALLLPMARAEKSQRDNVSLGGPNTVHGLIVNTLGHPRLEYA